MLTNLLKYFRLALPALIAAPLLAGCDSAIYDEEGDCDIHYRLKFSFDHNMLFAEAFPSQVHSVAVYAFDAETGLFAWQREESGFQLDKENYLMNLDGVKPGKYNVITWCGLDNAHLGDLNERPEAFKLPTLTPGVSKAEDLKCRLEREIDAQQNHHSRRDLWDLYHGNVVDPLTLEPIVMEIIDPNSLQADGQTVTYVAKLKKNTNRVRVILQQLGGQDIEAENFSYTITGDNGYMAHNNDLIPDQTITYHPHQTGTGMAGVDLNGPQLAPASRETNFTPVKVALADFTVARLVEEPLALNPDKKTTLTVYAPDGSVSARVPLVDYAILAAQSTIFYKDGKPYKMADQEYLDREDTYTLTFFLDRNKNWQAVSLQILSWRLVLQSVELS